MKIFLTIIVFILSIICTVIGGLLVGMLPLFNKEETDKLWFIIFISIIEFSMAYKLSTFAIRILGHNYDEGIAYCIVFFIFGAYIAGHIRAKKIQGEKK